MDSDGARLLVAGLREWIERASDRLRRGVAEATAAQDEPGEMGSEGLYEDELDAGFEEDLAEQLRALERAEARLAQGTYGLSVLSGQPIPDERLEVLPTAELTLEEEAQRGRG